MIHYDTHVVSLNKHGEELCGDQVKIHRTADQTLVVLSDGLGSGVKANILARLSTEILVTMLRQHVPLVDVLQTVFATLPTCKVRHLAYAAFVVVEIEHATGHCRIINFDCPPPFLLRERILVPLETREETISGRKLLLSETTLNRGDFLAVVSDGVMYAGMGLTMNFGWGREQVGLCLEGILKNRPSSAGEIVRRLMAETNTLYGGHPGDDATMAGILAREPNRLMVFTGPPLDPALDATMVGRLLAFVGRKVVCGGTTSNIVAEHVGGRVETDLTTLCEDYPPIGTFPGIDLMTEGVLTLAGTLRLLKRSQGDERNIGTENNGATMLTRELLRADTIHVLAGQQVNPYYQNPLLPRNISIRHNLIEQIAETLTAFHKSVQLEWC